ncbi:hypothetical protein IPA_09420 [Ignicoccus pacificus DSM 13166]|uniref:Uncharacterized protein n=1 Tax=Ignicoccus pacificus DSM 13166 TaxID=940294 RepID=A0A977KC37_9CREN|nr:hypothetical protein IPA_09420 [Ignicoccus pacificus DSM 13166]
MNKRVLVGLLLISMTIFAANATVYLKVVNNKVELCKMEVKGTYSGTTINKNVLKSSLKLNSIITEGNGVVKEKISTSGSSELKASLLKRGSLKLNFSLRSNATAADLGIRIRGSVLVSLIYVRNSDLKINIILNKNSEKGLVKITGFVGLTTPVTVVKNLLKVQVPKIKKQMEEHGVKIIKFDYKVTGKKVPPMTRVDVDIEVEVSKDSLKSALDNFGLGYLTGYLEVKDNITRIITGNATALARVKSITVNDIPEFFTTVTFKAEALGKYYNTTVVHELRNRLKFFNKILNITSISDYLLSTTKASSSVTANYEKGKASAIAQFQGVYFKDSPAFWKSVFDIAKKENVKVLVTCPSGSTKTLTAPTNPCK